MFDAKLPRQVNILAAWSLGTTGYATSDWVVARFSQSSAIAVAR